MFELKALPGERLDVFIDKAQALLFTDGHDGVQFDWNDIKCVVTRETNQDWMWREYFDANTMGWEVITGTREYTPQLIEEIKIKTAAKEKEARRQQYLKLKQEFD